MPADGGVFGEKAQSSARSIGNDEAVEGIAGPGYFRRFPDYFIKGLPYLDEIEMHLITDPQALAAAILSKRVFWNDAFPHPNLDDDMAQSMVKQNANVGVAATLNSIGREAVLEGKKARSFPLRFVDGAVMFGPVKVGQVPPLF